MGRQKKTRTVVENPPAIPSTGETEVYTLLHNPDSDDDPVVEIKARPRSKTKTGASVPLLGHMKLFPSPNIIVEDMPGPNPIAIVANEVVTILDKKIMTDAAGDYVLIQLKPNRQGGRKLDEFFREHFHDVFQLKVTVFVDLGGLAGGVAGINIPTGVMKLPVSGSTKIRLRLNQWKVSFSKPMWQTQGRWDQELAKITVDGPQALEAVCREGGTVYLTLDGGIKLDDKITLWNEKNLIDAEVYLTGPAPDKIRGQHEESEDRYSFNIPQGQGLLTSVRRHAQIRLEVWPEDSIQNRLRSIVPRTRDADKILGSTSLKEDGEKYIQGCLDYLASNTGDYLWQKQERFTNATHAATYFQGFTVQAAKALELSLMLHRSAYNRYLENLVAGGMEIIFWAGEKKIEEMVSKRLINEGPEAVEKMVKQARGRTLAHEAVEEAEKVLKAKQVAAREAQKQALRNIEAYTPGAAALQRYQQLPRQLAELETEKAAKQAAQSGLRTEVDAIQQTVRNLEAAGVPRDPSLLKQELEHVTRQTQVAKNLHQARTRVAELEMQIEQLGAKSMGGQQKQAVRDQQKQALREQLENQLLNEKARMAPWQKQIPSPRKGETLDDVVRNLSSKQANLSAMQDALARMDQQKNALKEALKNLDQVYDTIKTQKAEFKSFTDAIDDMLENARAAIRKAAEAGAESQVLKNQLDALAAFRTAAPQTEEEFKRVFQQVASRWPQSQQALAQQVRDALQAEGALKTLDGFRNLEKELADASRHLTGEALTTANATLAKLRAFLHEVEIVEILRPSTFAQWTNYLSDWCKGALNERAQKVHEAIESATHLEWKAQDPKYYQNSQFPRLHRQYDEWCAEFATWWNWFIGQALEDFSGIKSTAVAPAALRGIPLEDTPAMSLVPVWGTLYALTVLTFLILTAVLVILDILLQILIKCCEALLYVANTEFLSRSLLTEESRDRVLHPVEGMAFTLPQEFFDFSKDLVVQATQAVHPKNAVNQPGGKDVIADSIKKKFFGSYQEYYEAQWHRVRQFMINLAGANGALDLKWLDSDRVKGNNRESTLLLGAIIKPMREYYKSFEKGDSRFSLDILSDVPKGEFTANDIDKLLQNVGEFISVGMKVVGAGLLVRGLFAFLFPPAAPVMAAATVAGTAAVSSGATITGTATTAVAYSGLSDRAWATFRIATVAFFTMPDILGAQFDILRAYSLAHQSVFHGLDVSNALKPAVPEWIKERAGPFGVYG